MKCTRVILILLVCFSNIQVFAKYVDPETAKKVGEQFLMRNVAIPTGLPPLTLAYTFKSSASVSTGKRPLVYIYVFNAGNTAFVMVAADDAVEPIIGYSVSGSFKSDRMPINARKFFEGYRSEIRYAITQKLEPTTDIQSKWSSLLTRDYEIPNQAGGTSAVTPLLRTTWDQSPYYNALCPFDQDRNTRAVTGCVATSMAQIMKYWNYPAKGSGFFSYNHKKYGTLSANFGGTTYNWASMPNNVTSSNTAVATLMYQCGVAVEMDYGVDASGAYPNKIADAMKKYFGYASTTRYVEKINGYTDAQWITLMKTELDAGRPINYCGNGGGGGHSFVCDGYDNNNKFHMNWGWGGSEDGYFTLSALNPGTLGTGGGTGGFNSYQRAIIGISPNTPPAQTINMTLYAAINVSPDPIPYGNAFTVTSNIANFGTASFNGDYCMAIFDDSLDFVDFVEIKTGYTLGPNNTYQNNLSFAYAGSFSLLPGTYYLSMYYRQTGGQWQAVNNGTSLTNQKKVNIVNTNNIRLYSNLTTTPKVLVKGQPVSVNFNILNNGTTTFTGQYSAGIYKMDGSGVQTIGTYTESNGLPAQYVYQNPFITLSNQSVTAEPGTYLLAVQHKPTGSTAWQLTGTGNFQNPVKVVVRLPDLTADPFEPNNSTAQPYTFVPSFTADSAVILAEGANCHIVNDYDYYRINLSAGYNYTLNARLHDDYNSGNGKTYSLDALFTYSYDGTTWSDAIDDILPSPLSIAGGKTIFLKVAPYFAGETGTYLLDLRLKRTVVTAVNDPEARREVRIYPNPVSTQLYININTELQGKKWRYELTDMSGRTIQQKDIQKNDAVVVMDRYPSGAYLLKIYNGMMLVRTENIMKR